MHFDKIPCLQLSTHYTMAGRAALSRDDMERIIFFEQAKEAAHADVEKNPRDATALTQLGGALLELSHFQNMPESYQMIQEGADHFKAALEVDPRKHDTLWCLGNAYTSQGFLTADADGAKVCFKKARDAFLRALKEAPDSEMYQKAVEMTERAPELHADLHRQIAEHELQEQPMLVGRESGNSAQGLSSASTDFWYDVAGWAILVGIGYAWVTLARVEQPGLPVGK